MIKNILDQIGQLSNAFYAFSLLIVFFLLVIQHGFIHPGIHNARFEFRRGFNPSPAPDAMVFVALDERYAEHFDYPVSVPREYLAKLVDTVAGCNARVIALDVKFIKKDQSDPGYIQLIEAVKNAGNVVLPSMLLGSERSYSALSIPEDSIKQYTRLTGFAELWGDPVHQARLHIQLQDNRVVPSFALATLAAWHYAPGAVIDTVSVASMLKSVGLPAPDGERLYINYQGLVDDRYFKVYSSERLLASTEAYCGFLDDKLVLIGATYLHPDGDDTFNTPFGAVRGAEIHANVIRSLLGKSYLWPNKLGLITALAALILLLTFYFIVKRFLFTLKFAVIIGVAIIIYVAISFLLLAWQSAILPIYLPVLSGLFGLFVYYNYQQWSQTRDKKVLFDELKMVLSLSTKEEEEPPLIRWSAVGRGGVSSASIEVKLPAGVNLTERSDKAISYQQAKEMGADLFNLLFRDVKGKRGSRPYLSKSSIFRRKKGVRIWICSDNPAIQALPWEYLYDDQEEKFLACDPVIQLIRGVSGARINLESSGKGDRILVLFADTGDKRAGLPGDEGATDANVFAALEDAFAASAKKIEVDVVKPAYLDIIKKIDVRSIYTLHVRVNTRKEEGRIMFEVGRKKGGERLLTGKQFVEVIRENSGLNPLPALLLDVTTNPLPEAGESLTIAQQLVKNGVYSVAILPPGMDKSTYLQTLGATYKALLDRRTLEEAITQSRIAAAADAGAQKITSFKLPVIMRSTPFNN